MILNLPARVLYISLICCLQATAFSQTPTKQSPARTASISGRVTIAGKPAARKRVLAREVKPGYGNSGTYWQGDESRSGKIFTALTDGNGQYRIIGLAAGQYEVGVEHLKSYVPAGQSSSRSRFIHLEEGEEKENIDFALIRGGVITGRLTDPNGKPVVGAHINITVVDQNRRGMPASFTLKGTDDRGVYRAYGLPAGRYMVSSHGIWTDIPGTSGNKYSLTYHPDVIDEKEATIIEVKEGSEVSNVDITLSNKKSGYDVIGQVIDSETGKPLSQGALTLYSLGAETWPGAGYRVSESIDSQGNFRLLDLPSGRYSLILFPETDGPGQSEFYSEPTLFEVTQSDLSGLVVKAKRCAVINGTVAFDDHNPSLKDRISQVLVSREVVLINDGQSQFRSYSRQNSKVKSDGSFSMPGISPGTIQLQVGSSAGGRPPHILRVERNGVAIPNQIEVNSGETINGIRLVLAYGTGIVRGQVNFIGGAPPKGLQFRAYVNREGDSSSSSFRSSESVIVDKNGRFVIEGLMEGQYEVMLEKGTEDGSSSVLQDSQHVQIGRSSVTQVTFTVDLSKEKQENER